MFSASIKDIMDENQKRKTPKIDPRLILPKEYHDLIDVFSKKDSNTLLGHRTGVDHHIEFTEGTSLD